MYAFNNNIEGLDLVKCVKLNYLILKADEHKHSSLKLVLR